MFHETTGTGAGEGVSSAQGALVNFIHLSDLHVGISSAGWLWPAIRSAFLADLRVVLHEAGPPDVVVFSGDLAQKASEQEYLELRDILEELWRVFAEFGANPVLVPVPGNHDLLRRPGADPVVLAMKEWWSRPEVQEAFWDPKIPAYREFVEQSFKNYQAFCDSLASSSVRVPENIKRGVVPGDISVELNVRGNIVGIVGLNSAWLQVNDEDYKGRLHIDPRQLMGVVDGDPDGWCRRHAANFVVTHHPTSWLHPESERAWRAEIHCGARFDCHLFGHMHEPQSISVSEGGHEGRRLIQAASLFGLEWIGNQRAKRIHGYCVGQLFLSDQKRRLRQWPRHDVLGTDGVRKVVPNLQFNLTDYRYFDIDYSGIVEEPRASQTSTDISIYSDRKALDTLRRTLPSSEAARYVRKIEQETCLESLEKRRLVWIASDWGLGADEFLAELVGKSSGGNSSVYQLDLGAYGSREEMLAGVRRDFGLTFQQLCECISQEPDCFLVFDDVVLEDDSRATDNSYLLAISEIAEGVLEYCPNVRLVIRSRRNPVQTKINVVELTSLDDVDAMIYIKNHPRGGRDLATDNFVRKICSYTDGMPSRIDSALDDVQVVGLEGLHLANPDVSGKAALHLPPPPGLAETIAKLEQSDDPGALRAFRLLAVLSMFPRGEYLESVRRFDGANPFHPQDARRLIDLALVDTGEITSIGGSESAGSAKALIVRRPVREFLIAHLSPETVQRLNRQALSLYFGANWNAGAIKPPRDARFDERSCENWKIDNATLLVMREASEAIAAGVNTRISSAATLAQSFCIALMNGDHFGGLITAARELLAIYKDVSGHDSRLDLIKSMLGRALRMSGYWDEARNVLKELGDSGLPKAMKRKNLLNLAMSSESLGEIDDAKLYAKQCIELDKNSREAMHSKAIILEQTTVNDPDRKAKLLRLAQAARRRKCNVLANNLLVTCMNESDDAAEWHSLAEQVIANAAEHDDQHNAMRVVLRLCQRTVSKNQPLEMADLSRVIEAYQYLLNESMDPLFGMAHKVLWKHFSLVGDTENLLRLFRYSSFKWQLRGRSGADLEYAAEVIGLLGDKLRSGFIRSTREVAYLIVRSGHTMKLLPSS
ncbi:3',5'-cyclic adenosine monophosphate phosphodiesterase CpdA [Dyella sp. AD56]|uniref:metallophosphoesterase family protein n=1 Tax=Dyella sp. AD56 TaxID=1528744 RepID=UPI000C867CF6|nr:metallophosphoesterase [Dyella sp. AD56]PMQ03724.1 3',5'-cyclic adenosine monophosphate phosphodiesterase CpdA [Dyella sp. AD56]